MIELRNIVRRFASGTGDMANVADDSSSPRFGLDAPWVLVRVRGWATDGTGSASLALKQRIAEEVSRFFDKTIYTILTFGTTGDAHVDWRIPMDEEKDWVFAAGDRIVPEWTNPNSPTMRWALEVEMAAVS